MGFYKNNNNNTHTQQMEGGKEGGRKKWRERERVFKLRVSYPELECRTQLLSSNSK